MASKIPSKTTTRSQIRWKTAGIAALSVFCLAVVLPKYINQGVNWVNAKTNIGLPRLPDKEFNLGLDLQGGAHLIYQAKTDQIPDSDRAEAVDGMRDVIENRVRGGIGVKEPLVQTTRVGLDYRIIVELPGIRNIEEAIEKIGKTPVLEFKEKNDEPPRELTPEEQKKLNEFNAQAEKKSKEALAVARRGTDFAELVKKYSEDEKTKNTGGDLGFITPAVSSDLYTWAEEHADGEVGRTLVKTASGYHVAKRLGVQDGDKRVSAAHLLICYPDAPAYKQIEQSGVGVPTCTASYTKETARAKIEEIKKEATPKNFAELVKKYSTEPGAGDRGGDLGFFKKDAMVPEFERVVWDQLVGTISNVVETPFGFHLIYKKAQDFEKQYHVAHIFARTMEKVDIVPPASEWKPTGLSGKHLVNSEVVPDEAGQIQITLKFDKEGAKLFGEITSRNVGKPVGIFLDGQLKNSPRVNEPILSGDAVITGGFSIKEAQELKLRLKTGALPVPIELIGNQQVDATLGADSLQKSFKAGTVGLLLVMLFMILYYRLPGILSVISLAMYALLTLALFKLIGVTLTLSGIAGFVLSIGMAVDANILVFERLKEEIRQGKQVRSALEESFTRAWPSIRDSHITALISCIFLIWFGGFVKGFATVLAFGTLINLFTAITVTRTIMRLVFHWLPERGTIFILGYTKTEEVKQN